MPIPVSVLNEDGTIRHINRAAEKYLSVVSEDVIGKHCHKVLHPSNLSKDECPLCQSIQAKNNIEALELHNTLTQTTIQYSLNFTQVNSQASIIHTCKDITLIHTQAKKIEILNKRIVNIYADISKNKEREALIQKQAESLYYLAHYDMLTGLANRVLLTDRLQQGIKKAKRYKTKLALFFIDINKFKPINDSLGHHVGDKALIEIAKRLKNTIREEDTIARFGGDEFIILLENVKNISLVKEKLKNTFKKAIIVDKHSFNITCSIGVSIYPDDADTVDNLLKDADSKMYKDKENTFFVSPLD